MPIKISMRYYFIINLVNDTIIKPSTELKMYWTEPLTVSSVIGTHSLEIIFPNLSEPLFSSNFDLVNTFPESSYHWHFQNSPFLGEKIKYRTILSRNYDIWDHMAKIIS